MSNKVTRHERYIKLKSKCDELIANTPWLYSIDDKDLALIVNCITSCKQLIADYDLHRTTITQIVSELPVRFVVARRLDYCHTEYEFCYVSDYSQLFNFAREYHRFVVPLTRCKIKVFAISQSNKIIYFAKLKDFYADFDLHRQLKFTDSTIITK